MVGFFIIIEIYWRKEKNMESLLFSLTPKQYKKYLEIINADKIELDFDFSIPDFAPYPFENARALINGLSYDASRIAAFKKNDLFFSELDKNEIAKLIPTYFEVIAKISKTSEALYLEISKISSVISQIEAAKAELNIKYNEFLPYKAALLEKPKYSAQIVEAESAYKESTNALDEHISEEIEKLTALSSLCEHIIPELLKDGSAAADSPGFKRFKQKEFFLAFDAFITRIKNI